MTGWMRGSMRLSTRVALAVGVLVPLLVLACGLVIVRLVGADLARAQDAQLTARAKALVPDARGVLRAGAADRAAAARAHGRRLYAAALDTGVRVTGPDGEVASAAGPPP